MARWPDSDIQHGNDQFPSTVNFTIRAVVRLISSALSRADQQTEPRVGIAAVVVYLTDGSTETRSSNPKALNQQHICWLEAGILFSKESDFAPYVWLANTANSRDGICTSLDDVLQGIKCVAGGLACV